MLKQILVAGLLTLVTQVVKGKLGLTELEG